MKLRKKECKRVKNQKLRKKECKRVKNQFPVFAKSGCYFQHFCHLGAAEICDSCGIARWKQIRRDVFHSRPDLVPIYPHFGFILKGGSRGDVGDAFPHQPFSKALLINTIFS